MPKNVVEARIYHQDVKLLMDSHGFELPEYGDSINVMISYLADGRINKVDIHGFHNGRSVSVSIRRRSDDLVMTSAAPSEKRVPGNRCVLGQTPHLGIFSGP